MVDTFGFRESPHYHGIVVRAEIFAIAAHEAVGQVRKYTGEPYFHHVAEVASIVATVEHTQEMLMAALLHDVLEDTKVTRSRIEYMFGKHVASMVLDLTDAFPSHPHAEGRAKRKAKEARRLGKIWPVSQTVKCADIISNTSSIVRHDPEFASLYLLEKTAVLDELVMADPVLRKRAYDTIG